MKKSVTFEKIAAFLGGISAATVFGAILGTIFCLDSTETLTDVPALLVPFIISLISMLGVAIMGHKTAQEEDKEQKEETHRKAVILLRNMTEEELLKAQHKLARVCSYDEEDIFSAYSFKVMYDKWADGIESARKLKKKGVKRVHLSESELTIVLQPAMSGQGQTIESAIKRCEHGFNIAFERNAMMHYMLDAVSEALTLTNDPFSLSAERRPEDAMTVAELQAALEVAEDYAAEQQATSLTTSTPLVAYLSETTTDSASATTMSAF